MGVLGKIYLTPKRKFMSTQNLRTCPYLEMGSLQMQLVKIRSLWNRVGPNAMTGVLRKQGR